jgi:hypothetical protein
VVGPEERLETDGLGALDDGQLFGIGQALLGLDHQGKAHQDLLTFESSRSSG